MSLAKQLNLGHFSPIIASAGTRRQSQSERSKLKMLLRIWRDQRPESYNLKELKCVLAKEVGVRFLHCSCIVVAKGSS